MNIKDLIEIVQSYGLSYIHWFSSGILQPSSLGDISITSSKANLDHEKENNLKNISIYLLLSIFIGATIGAIIPGRPPIVGRVIVFVVVICLWFFLSGLFHLICKALGGKGKLKETTLVMVQLLAFAYVISNFFTLIIITSAKTYSIFENFLKNIHINSPGHILLGTQFLFLIIYVPLSLSFLHRFNILKRILAGLLAASFAYFFGGLIFFSAHGC